jgi:hypothetical protein
LRFVQAALLRALRIRGVFTVYSQTSGGHTSADNLPLHFSSLVDQLLTTLLAFDKLMPCVNERNQVYETDTRNIAERRSGVSSYALDFSSIRRADRSDRNSYKSARYFCEAYWPPLYAFVRRRGHASPEAQDLVQGFFAHLLEQNTLSRADKEKGRLRTFLLGSLQNFLCKEYVRAGRLKRGGGHRIVSIDEYLPEAEASMVTLLISAIRAVMIWLGRRIS